MTKHESVLTGLRTRFEAAKRDERHHNAMETQYWLEQYRQIADSATAILSKQAAQVEPVAASNVTKTAPKKIYLNIFTDEPPETAVFPENTESVTWCEGIVGDDDVAYIRADLVYTTTPASSALVEAAEKRAKTIYDFPDNEFFFTPEQRPSFA